MAAHEIRGPLTSLRLAVQALGRAPPGPTAAKLTAIVEREERRITRLVDELLDVTRIRSGQLRFDFTAVDLVEVTRKVTARLSAELSQSGSSLTIIAPGLLVGTWDPGRVDQIVANLLGNAIKFGLGKPIEIQVQQRNGAATLTVRDQGIGISPEAQRRIFAPFERAVSARHYGGLGLGLYIVRTIAEGMGGSVQVESDLGAGSTFVVTLPLAKP